MHLHSPHCIDIATHQVTLQRQVLLVYKYAHTFLKDTYSGCNLSEQSPSLGDIALYATAIHSKTLYCTFLTKRFRHVHVVKKVFFSLYALRNLKGNIDNYLL